MKPVRWRIADLFDLDFLLEQDRRQEEHKGSRLARRDRALFQKLTEKTSSPGKPPDDGVLLKGWVEDRRREVEALQGEEIMPGRLWKEAASLSIMISLVIGLLAGIGVCLPYLSYTGDAPLNVTVYFGVFVVTQFLLAAFQLLVFFVRSLRGVRAPKSVLALILVRLVFGMIDRLGTRFSRVSTPGLQRLSPRGVYAQVSLWSAFMLLQLVAVGFNLGVIGTTITKVAVSDMAFGWQSTLQVQEQVLFQLVQWAALPWSAIVPEYLAFPSLQAIEGSRIILKEGVRHLATADLVTWWPFLCLSVLSYGLLPRLMFFCFGLYRQRRELLLFPVVDAEIRSLLRRMKTPAVETGSQVVGEEVEPRGEETEERVQEGGERHEEPPAVPESKAVLLIPEELYEELDGHEPAGLTAQRIGWTDCAEVMYPFGEFEGDDLGVMRDVEEIVSSGAEVRICVLQEGWQPPIEESLDMLRRLRSCIGESAPITVLLVGKPRAETLLTPASGEHVAVWRMKIDLLSDSNMEVLSY